METDQEFRSRIMSDHNSVALDQWSVWLGSGYELDALGRKIGLARDANNLKMPVDHTTQCL